MKTTLIVLAALLQTACATTDLTDFKTVRLDAEDAAKSTRMFVHANDLPVRSGQVIVSEAGSPISFLMNLMAEEFKPYGHAGVIIVEPDGIFVYEAFSFLNLRIWEPPTHRLRGNIRRVPLIEFLQRGTVAALYQHDVRKLDAIAAFVTEAFEARLAFDGLFDYRTDSSVYCSEFVAAALVAAGLAETLPTPRTNNPSLNRTMDWLDLDTPGFILAADLLANASRVALFSKRYSRAQVEAHFAFEREMHRRFKEDQSLGNIFRWTASGPRYRPHLAELRDNLLADADMADKVDDWVAQEMAAAISGPAD